jgi:peptidoglycan/xylan/chitin deacetylase (PgdA/CDA1 family)
MMPGATLLTSVGVGMLTRGLARRGLSILMYHRVLPESDPINTWDVTAEEFDVQMCALAEHFTPLALGEAVARLHTDSLPPGAICVTFDDGYADNVTTALPILQQHRIPATFFIATAYLNGGRMWNDTVVEAVRAAAGEEIDLEPIGLGRLALGAPAIRRPIIERILEHIKHRPFAEREHCARLVAECIGAVLPGNLMLTDAQLLALRASGMEIGGHTDRHPILTSVDARTAREEIAAGRERLVELLREPITLFAYPNGKPGVDYGHQHVQMVRSAGFVAAVTTAEGVATRATDPLQLPRQAPWDRNPITFSLRLARSYLRPASDAVAAA